MTTTVYCFVDAQWGDDVAATAVCGECGATIGGHMSSNADWAHFDIMRPYHEREYVQHVTERHGESAVTMRWLDKPLECPELLALLERLDQNEETSQP